jgi:hypothetical protein
MAIDNIGNRQLIKTTRIRPRMLLLNTIKWSNVKNWNKNETMDTMTILLMTLLMTTLLITTRIIMKIPKTLNIGNITFYDIANNIIYF